MDCPQQLISQTINDRSFSEEQVDLCNRIAPQQETDSTYVFNIRMPLAGDFYNEPDDVIRSVTLKSMPGTVGGSGEYGTDKLMMDSNAAKANPHVHFRPLYDFGDDSSLAFSDSCPFASDAFSCLEGRSSNELVEQQTPLFELGFEPISNVSNNAVGAGSLGNLLLASDHPPPLSDDPFFELAVTTFYVSTTAASETMNELLEFFESKVSISVTKVNRQKFAIKADIFVDGHMCCVKIRGYDANGQSNCRLFRMAVEFQRRSGDSVVFNKVYALAAQHFSPHAASTMDTPEVTKVCVPFGPMSTVHGDVYIEPLFDMAAATNMPDLQAESAAMLAEIAEDGKFTSRLCTSEAVECFQALLAASRIDIVYPTACCLHALAKQPTGIQCFVKGDLLTTMVEHATSVTATGLVKQELAQTLNTVIKQFGPSIPNEISDCLGDILARSLLKVTDAPDQSVYQNLQQAHAALQLRSSQAKANDQLAPCGALVQCGFDAF